jgi:isopenicillin N synthase-like dioxygenase
VFYESFDLSFEVAADDHRTHQGYGLVGPNIWPELSDFQSKVTGYYDAVYALGRELLSIFECGLGMAQGTLLTHVTVPPSQLRLLKYFENDAPADRLHHGIDAHSDFECLTILHATHPGLQLLSADDHWVETPPVEGCFTILMGDCLEAWTGGDLKATQHRVVNRGVERFSLPFFFSADYDCEVKPQSPFDTAEAKAAYPTFKAGEHLWSRTITNFPYLRKLVDQGKLAVDFEVTEESPFKRLSVEERALLENTAQT